MKNRTNFAALLAPVLVLFLVGKAFSADPCFDQLDSTGGLYANCIPVTNCTSGVVVPGPALCQSYPIDYVCCFQENFPGRELRGAWIATVVNIDFPISPNSSVATQQEEIRFIIDQLHAARINAVYFQVRPVGDALYASDIEPWSKYLTGQQGKAPEPLWDPLHYMINYCKMYEMEVHAWVNPYRANMSPDTEGLAPNHMAIMYPECAYPYGAYLWMDPGCAAVQNRTYNVCMDLVTRYDLNGIHMDDYFYPYPVEAPFPDNATYNDYLTTGGNLPIEDWRRDNVNQLVRRIHQGVRAIKSWVGFSIAPFGIYRAGHPEGHPSPPITGFDPYTSLHCDAKLWLQEGWVDALQPQLYWRIDPPAQSYPILLNWWLAQNRNPNGHSHVNAGIALYRVQDQDWDLDEIRRQVEISRLAENRVRGSWGNIHFSARYIRDNFKGLVGYFNTTVYPMPAFTPPLLW